MWYACFKCVMCDAPVVRICDVEMDFCYAWIICSKWQINVDVLYGWHIKDYWLHVWQWKKIQLCTIEGVIPQVSLIITLILQHTLLEKVGLSHKKSQLMTLVWSKLCGFIHYNVQYYVAFIMAYNTPISIWH
jgi:hypothetical protein